MKGLMRLLAWSTLAGFILSPPNRLLPLPAGIEIVDLIWLLLMASWGAWISLIGFRLPRPHFSPALAIFILYVATKLFLPVLGIVVFNAPLEWYLGDLRWLQVVSTMLLLMSIYMGPDGRLLLAHIYGFVWAVILLQLPFLISQLNMSILGKGPNQLLKYWYYDGVSAYGAYGHHIGRYAAGLKYASELGRLGATGFLI